jgi:hypothetical protein
MASISRDTNGWRRIQFTGPDGIRKTLRLGEVSQQTADTIRCRIELLLTSDTDPPADKTFCQNVASSGESWPLPPMGDTGLEPVTPSLSIHAKPPSQTQAG